MIVEEAPRPAGPYSHAVITYCFVFVARLTGRRALRRARLPMSSTTKSLSMRTILGDVGPNLRVSLCRGEVVYGVGRFVGAGIKKDSAEEDRDGLRRAISSLGAILRGHQVHRGEGISG